MKLKGISGRYPQSVIRYPLLTAAAVVLMACAPKGESLFERAEKSLQAGAINAAVIDLKNLIKDEPDNARARALLAAALVEAGQMSAAEIEIEKARSLGAPVDALLVTECRVLVAKRSYDEVLSRCKPEAASEAIRPDLQVVTGRALGGMERFAEAKPYFEAARSARPGSLDALLGFGGAVYELQGLAAAKTVLDAAPPEIRSQPRYWMAIGGINVQGEDYAAAEAAFQEALSKFPKGSDDGERLAALGSIAEVQMRQGKVKEAQETTAQLTKAAPNNPLVKQLRGQVAAAAGDLDEARTLLEEAVAEMPENLQARMMLGVVNLRQGNFGQAEMHFAAVLSQQPNDIQARRMLAQTRARLTSPEQSLESMKGALAAEDVDPSLLSMAASMSLASGDRKQAMTYLAQAAEHAADKDNPEVALEIAGGYLVAGDIDAALAVLEQMPEQGTGPGSKGVQREILLMMALLRKGDADRALVEVDRLLQQSPDDVAVRNLAASVYIAAQRQGEARGQLEQALKLDPDDVETLANLGRLDLMQGNAADAEARFEKILEKDPKSLTAMVGLAVAASTRGDNAEAEKWLQRAASENPESQEAQAALAQFYLGARNPEKALGVTGAASKKWPDNAEVMNLQGMAQLMKSDTAGAIASFERATALRPRVTLYVLNMARAHLQNRDLDSALGVLNEALKADPGLLPALALAAAASLQARQTEKASGYVERLRRAAPDAPVTLGLEGELAMQQKRYAEALQFYRKAGSQGKSRELVISEFRAASAAKAARPEAVLEEWVAKNPDDSVVVAVLADLKQRRGDRVAATALYERALDTAPNDPIVLNNLAVIYSDDGNPKAVELAERAYLAAPKSAAIADTYGWILFKQGKKAEGLKLLREAARGLPDNAEVQYHLAVALADQGERAEAEALLKKAVNGQLSPEQKVAARQLLEQLSR